MIYKKITAIIILLSFIVSCSSCFSRPEINVVGNIKLIPKNIYTDYLTTNGLKVSDINTYITVSGTAVHIEYPNVSGFSDDKFNVKMNETILNDIEEGIKPFVNNPNYIDQGKSEFYCRVHLNCSNILSIGVYSSNNLLFGMLYSLVDGGKLALGDIFTKGTDYVSLINQKVVVGFFNSEYNMEDNLSEPFKSIKPDQGFCLTDSKLTIIFKEGESGFISHTTSDIPISDIRDYIDILDRYPKPIKGKYTNTEFIQKKNNIIVNTISEFRNSKNGQVWVSHPEISGLKDTKFQKKINDAIREDYEELFNKKVFDSMEGQTLDKRIADIQVKVEFNDCGIITFSRNVTCFNTENFIFGNYFNVYSFDLINKKKLTNRDIIKRILKACKIDKNTFCENVKKSLASAGLEEVSENNGGLKIDYDFIAENGMVYLWDYGNWDRPDFASAGFSCIFNKGSINEKDRITGCYRADIREYVTYREFFDLL